MFVCAAFSLLQAPGQCKWLDVVQLIAGAPVSFASFAEHLEFKPLPSAKDDFVIPAYRDIIKNEWRGATVRPRSNDEGMIRPVIHSMLQCAALSANKISARNFVVTAELNNSVVVGDRSDRLSDECIWEVVKDRENGVYRVVLEVKGSAMYRGTFAASCEEPFSQVIQQVALALEAGLWQNEILCGLATHLGWYVFKINELAGTSRVQLHIKECYSFKLPDPRETTVGVTACVRFIINHLCVPLQH